ncbi:zinc finger C3H1 domain-containing protein isoform X2 [Nelusetta ayraudi]|uniref:zinc finger C3H1 domain-containing protein isoform X2 n=1 Tax=Nelusetta ayraudi TaxID=303726 RepID=UPI003F72F4CA
MDSNTQGRSRSPREEGELEDGEICDDETEESAPIQRLGDGNRPGRGAPPRPQKSHRHPHSLPPPPPPHMGHQPADFRLIMPYNRPHGHGPFPPSHRQQCGPSGPDRPPGAAPPPLLPLPLPPPPPGMPGLPGLPPHGEPAPRTSGFWERSHGALGRFRHRAGPNGRGGNWNRGNRGGGNNRGRYGAAEGHANNKGSPLRKQKIQARNQASRKAMHSVPKADSNVDESFEDLLSKYKQIQLELECIRKEETKALEPQATLDRVQPLADGAAAGVRESRLAEETAPAPEEQTQLEPAAETKGFQAFNIKPLRQKLPTGVNLDELRRMSADQENGGEAQEEVEMKTEAAQQTEARTADDLEDEERKPCVCCSKETDANDGTTDAAAAAAAAAAEPAAAAATAAPAAAKCSCRRESSASSEDSVLSNKEQPEVKVDEEELSELQLRLLALQSASKKWQQKEQQVLRRSKDRITKPAPEKTAGSGAAAAAAAEGQRQRVTTRSASKAAATAASSDRSRTRSKTGERERDRTKTPVRPADRERAKPAARGPADRGRTPGKASVAKKTSSPGSVAKQAARKQQLRTWKQQQQREQEEKRRQEEEERRKREEEIRRIRDLSNQDEQYNRFMKLVGGKARPRGKSTDREHRKSAGKQLLDASGNLYQYDNYDEVAMETDSEEAGSPVASPTHAGLPVDDARCLPHLSHLGVDFQPIFPAALSAAPPPPPPPPSDELLAPPPKPPFADEEEEEEMLLRETCLMSMANKRVVPNEERSHSAPASPGSQPPVGVALQPPARGNLSTVSLNTVAQARSSKFATRGHHRVPLVLPKHKTVVVSLVESDDSDSDVDAGDAAQSVFGGLEFMIKEARRTAEASKPKPATGSEKENNPVRTPEALPDAKKAEYRQLREEIANREKQKMLKDHSLSAASPTAAAAATSDPLQDAFRKPVSEAEQRLGKHRELLQRDEAILRQLLQQELKKRESLKAAESKVAKLKEQLQASEKIAGANRTLLKKLQEQVQRVEHRVSMKKTVAARLVQELARARQMAGRGPKRRADANHVQVSKLQRLDAAHRGSERHFAELIAQKQRLQQLESEYARKIQKLKEAQALRNKGPLPDLQGEPAARASPPPDPQNQPQAPPQLAPPQLAPPPLPPPSSSSPSSPSSSFPVPQPSLHDLTQDKLTLDSEDVPEADEQEAEPAPPLDPAAPAAAVGARRHSFRQSNSNFTKPHLEQLSSAPAGDSGGSSAKAAKASAAPASSRSSTESLAGLDVKALVQRHQQQARLGELFLRELHKMEPPVDQQPSGQLAVLQLPSVEADAASSQSAAAEMKPVPFGSYHSPLLVFRSYRFSPYYRTKEKLSLSSVTYSNAVEPAKCFCRFDLTGTCNDDDCRWQHMRNCTLTGNQLLQDILSYSLPLIGCPEGGATDEDVGVATEKYMKKLFGPNKDRMGLDQKAVLLVSMVNEHKRHVPPFTTCKDPRRWRPKPSAPSSCSQEVDNEDEAAGGATAAWRQVEGSRTAASALDICVTSEDKRYFLSETDDISNLETSVLESPQDTQLWIKLAFRYLSQNETSAAECLEAALNTLSRALETNCDDPEVWSHYLSLFSRRGSKEEVQEMCEMAVEHAPNHRVWWNYLNLESSFEGKDYVCDRLLQFLLGEASSGTSEKLSFQLMEALLYRVHLNLFTGRMESALAILQNALKSAKDRSVSEHLTAGDRSLLWLSYIHLTEFDQLPAVLYNPAESNPSRLVSRESFLLPWRSRQDLSTPPDILIALFQDGIRQCSDESASTRERTLACLPLHTNLIRLNKLLERFEEAAALCHDLLGACPDSCTLRDALAELHLQQGDEEQAVDLWLQALAECPNNAEVFYRCCRFLMAREKRSAVAPLFRGFILSFCEEQQSESRPVDILRHLLGFPTEQLVRVAVSQDLQEQLARQTPFLHLIHCRWQWLYGSPEDAAEAFERALGLSMQLEELHQLWMDYLLFSCSLQGQSAASSQSRLVSDLVLRCLSTVPTRLELPFNPSQFWSCYRFHNKVVSLYLSCLPSSQHEVVLERLRYAMPNNTELGLRLLHQEWQDGNTEQLRFQARALCSSSARCLTFWNIAIAVASELKERSEVRHLYQQALNSLPLCAPLWKHRLLFEAAEGGQTDRLPRLLERCQQVGVSLSE